MQLSAKIERIKALEKKLGSAQIVEKPPKASSPLLSGITIKKRSVDNNSGTV